MFTLYLADKYIKGTYFDVLRSIFNLSELFTTDVTFHI